MDTPAALTRFRSALDGAIEDVLGGRDGELFDMMRHQLGWENGALTQGGKYVRPILVFVTTEACGGDWKAVLPAAVSLEMLHNFSLIHDDIQDNSPLRRNRPTVWNQWGSAQAINAGDAMHALSQLVMLRMVERNVPAPTVLHAIRLLDQTCLALCEGQTTDIGFQNRLNVTVSDYEEMIGNKTAEAFRCAMEIGCMLATGSQEQSRLLGEVGFQMGLAFQIHDDALDLWGGSVIGKETALDVRDGKKSLPVVFGLSREDSDEAERLRDMYRRGIQPDDVDTVVALLESLGAPEFCADEARAHWVQGRRLIEEAGLPSGGAAALIEIGDYLMTRTH